MAAQTKSTAKKTTKTTAGKGSNGFPEAYMRLRTVLDGLEISALRYCLKDADATKRIRRAKKIEAKLMPIIQEFQNSSAATPPECPDGFYDCGGCCLPYQCPFSDHSDK